MSHTLPAGAVGWLVTAVCLPVISGVTMWWLLRSNDTGATCVGALWQKNEFKGPNLRQWWGTPDGCISVWCLCHW